MQKKTLIITLEYPPVVGGIASYVHHFAGALDPKQTIVLAPHHPQATQWDEQVPYTVRRRTLLVPLIWPQWLGVLWHTVRIAKKHQVRVVMNHHVLPVGYACWVAKKLCKVLYIQFVHGADISSQQSTKPRKVRMIRRMLAAADGVVVNSEGTKKALKQIAPVPDQKITTVYPAASTDLLDPPPQKELDRLRAQYALDGKKVLLSVARIDEGKGFPHLAYLLPEIVKKVPNVVWVVAGDGPKRKGLIDQVTQHDLHNVVRFVGRVPGDTLKALYYLADVFVLLTHDDPVRGKEGFGIAFLEAASAGLPVVAGRSGGVEEAVVHDKTGLVVDVHQKQQVIDAIVSLLQDADYAHRLARNAEHRAKNDFQWGTQVQRLQQYLDI